MQIMYLENVCQILIEGTALLHTVVYSKQRSEIPVIKCALSLGWREKPTGTH